MKLANLRPDMHTVEKMFIMAMLQYEALRQTTSQPEDIHKMFSGTDGEKKLKAEHMAMMARWAHHECPNFSVVQVIQEPGRKR